MIQVYVKTSDLIPTEAFDSVVVQLMLNKWFDSFVNEGFIWCLRINEKGEVDDGHARLLYALSAGIEYLPIDINWLMGTKGEKVLVK